MKLDDLPGFDRLAESERLYYMAMADVVTYGATRYPETEIDLLRRGHLEDYEGKLKLTESGFQLMNFFKTKMSGERPPLLREA